MAKDEKREARIRTNPTNVTLQDFEHLIEQYGSRVAGAKHYKAIIGQYVMTYKRENPVKSVYVRQLLGYIDRMKQF